MAIMDSVIVPFLSHDHVTTEQYNYLRIDHVSKLELLEKNNLEYDAIMVCEADQHLLKYIIRKIRNTWKDNIYLRPVITLQYQVESGSACEKYVTDGHAGTIDELEQFDPLVKQIRREIQALSFLHRDADTSPNKFWLNIAISYMRSRKKNRLTPVSSFDSSIGYIWPELSIHFAPEKQNLVAEILNWGAAHNYLSTGFSDIVYVCPCCGSNHLLFRETCTKCGSPNIEMEDLIHHFPCAYIGKASDYENGEQTKCPKCRKSLKNLGQDHDKPSSIYSCNHCNHSAQQPAIRAKCTLCRHETPVEQLKVLQVCEYNLLFQATELVMTNSMMDVMQETA
jgi:hypothetical protein